jgi:hypothetical protein
VASYTLTHSDLETLWELAGGPPWFADVAAAIAQAESGGCQYALAGPRDIRPVKACTWRRTNLENSCGYWQINLRAHPTYSAPSIFSKLTNAQAAVAVSQRGEDFSPWSTYTSGAYKTHLTSGGTPTTQPGAASGPTLGDDATRATAGYYRLQQALARTLPQALSDAQRLDRQTLRLLSSKRKVG